MLTTWCVQATATAWHVRVLNHLHASALRQRRSQNTTSTAATTEAHG